MRELYQTERLTIREWSEADASDLFEYCSCKETTKYLSFPTYTKMEEARERMKDREALYQAYGGHPGPNADWAITVKDESKAIGSIGFAGWDKANATAEIGYVLNSKYQKHGYMTEAVIGLLQYIKKHHKRLGIAKIESKCDVANTASKGVMERAGMQYQCILPGGTSNNTNQAADAYVYSLTIEI